MKNGASSAGARTPGQLAEPLRRVVRALHDALAELGEALRADEREVGTGRDRPEELRRPRVLLRVAALNVGRPLPDDLSEPVLALDDRRAEADEERRILGDEALLVGGGDEAREAAAVVHVDAERLELPADDVGAVARRSVEDAERGRVDADDEEGARVVGEGGQLSHLRLDRPEVARHLDVDTRCLAPDRLPHPVEVEETGRGVERDRRELDPRLAVARDQGAPLRTRRAGNERRRPSGDPRGHADRGRRCRGPVVRRHAHRLELDELPEHARELEQRLELAVVAVRLAVVGGQELAAVRDLVADGRDVVLPAPRSEEVERLGAVFVPAEDALDVAAQARTRSEAARGDRGSRGTRRRSGIAP